MHRLQLPELFPLFDRLQLEYGEKTLAPVYGAGCIKKPKILFLFMNPTGRNISAQKDRKGLRAAWLGTKNIWKLFLAVGVISKPAFTTIQSYRPNQWTPEFCQQVYQELNQNKIYVTNLAKCTQIDARPLHNNVFKAYLEAIEKEISLVQPTHIISFGNQVSSLLLRKNIKVSDYQKNEYEIFEINWKKYTIYPTFYPVGQGMRNIDKAIERIKNIVNN